jgi:hypothetical protein
MITGVTRNHQTKCVFAVNLWTTSAETLMTTSAAGGAYLGMDGHHHEGQTESGSLLRAVSWVTLSAPTPPHALPVGRKEAR